MSLAGSAFDLPADGMPAAGVVDGSPEKPEVGEVIAFSIL
jgi:hypothetical protein